MPNIHPTMLDGMMLTLVVTGFLLARAYAELCNHLLAVAATEDAFS